MTQWLMTFSGIHFPLINPQIEHFKLVDIAHALSLINRSGGHSKHRYSVALHSLLGAEKMKKDGHSYLLQLLFMLHDSPEAYYGDIPKPLKNILGNAYTRLEDHAMKMIWKAFCLPEPTKEQLDIIKQYDNLMFSNEVPKLMAKPEEYGIELRDDGLNIVKEDEYVVELTYAFVVQELLKRVIV